jgi:hypothetical protein
MAGTEHERRRFLTRHDVEDAADAGRSIRLQGRDVLTDEAAQRAMDLGVTVERAGSGGRGAAAGKSAEAAQTASRGSGAVSSDVLRRAVRAAVVAELGSEPPGLDAAIDRVLRRRSGRP